MTSSNGSVFYVTGSLCGEVTDHLLIPLTKNKNADLDVSLMWACIKCKTNYRMTGDLRQHDVQVTSSLGLPCFWYTSHYCRFSFFTRCHYFLNCSSNAVAHQTSSCTNVTRLHAPWLISNRKKRVGCTENFILLKHNLLSLQLVAN